MTLRIILADDHPVVLAGARAVILAQGVGKVVAEASDVQDLFRALSENACDVLVTDFAMPGDGQADGFPMIDQIRRLYPDLAIVLLSSTTNLAVLRYASDAGVLGLVDKKSSLGQLPTAILAASRGMPFVSETHTQQAAASGELLGDRPATDKISPKEHEVLRLIASGMTVTQIARRFNRQVSTISRQKHEAMRKLGLRSDPELFEFLRVYPYL